MDHAIWTKKLGESRYVSIEEIRRELGKDNARRQAYKCPSELCGVRMVTVFPRDERTYGKEVHKEHFRAPSGHKTNCPGDGARTEHTDGSPGDETDSKQSHGVVKTSTYPMRYFVRPHSSRNIEVWGGDNDPNSRPDIPTDEEINDRPDDIHISEPGTGHIRTIVEAYENPPAKLSSMKLSLPGCPAKNYEGAFVDVKQALDYRGYPRGYFIHYGNYREHKIYANNAISILFSQLSPIGWKFGVWIRSKLEPNAARQQIESLLRRCWRDKGARIYVFGRFEPFADWKHTIEIEAFGDLWITFPAHS